MGPRGEIPDHDRLVAGMTVFSDFLKMLETIFSDRFPENLPSLRWEGMKGRGDQAVSVLSTPTRTLPHRRGRDLYWKLEIS
jgi:hypothetical protein